jgi:hypothetical protein
MNSLTTERNMGPCLIQQLFRQKIGLELDQDIVDVVLFPLLLKKKDLPKELLVDIKMTKSTNDHGLSSIIQIFYGGDTRNSLPFTKAGDDPASRRRIMSGKNTSKLRRQTSYHTSWGSIDILNELRELIHLPSRYRLPGSPLQPGERLTERGAGGFFVDMSSGHVHARSVKMETEQVNKFLEHSLSPGNRLSWGGAPDRLFQPILSTYY